ncbi:MAG: gliding motility protein GldL [Bacteroidota bacterium]
MSKEKTKQKKSFVESKGFKGFMAKLYGFGAAIVILGALFKIQHYPGSEIMLPVGLGIEAVIFFFSALEKPHVEPDWSLVHPQFLDQYHNEKEIEALKASGKIPEDVSADSAMPTLGGGGGNGGATVQAGVMDSLLEKANIDDDTIKQFGEGLEKFDKQAKGMNDISEASVATKDFVKNLQQMSTTAGKMNQSMETASDSVNKTVEANNSYSENMKKAADATANLAETYQNATRTIDEQKNVYKQNVDKLAENLGALNAAYELQLKESNKQKETTLKLSEGVQTFVQNLESSNKASEAYQKELQILSEKVSALNNVYGNMLSAMNVNSPNK